MLLKRNLYIFILAAILSVVVSSCKKPTASNSQAAVNSSEPVDYAPRIGTVVRTDSRTCVAIRNGAVTPGSPITVVIPPSPQTFVEGQIGARSSTPCPISEEVLPDVISYDVTLTGEIAKLVPAIGVVGTPASSGFVSAAAGVEADLDQKHTKNTFRACGANDGVHLTVWRGVPVTGTLVWSGHYYETGNPGTLPNCVTQELAPVPAGH